MDWKKLGKRLLFPHLAIMILLIPVATAFLVVSMVVIGTETVPAYISYVLAAYTLTVWCFRMPQVIRFFKNVRQENRYAKRWFEDTALRVNVTLLGSFVWNAAYGVFQILLGVMHSTFWFSSIGAYYICLALMRAFLLLHTHKYAPGERMRAELIKYRACGWVFLTMNLFLSLIIFFMVYWNRTFTHHEITTITMAAYTFTSMTFAIINVVKYRKYESPIYSATKAISFAAACVSMLTLSSTMLTTFDDGSMTAAARQWMLAGVGVAVAAVILAMAIYMIREANKKIKTMPKKEQVNGRKEGI